MGKVPNQPAASNMRELTWDNSLAEASKKHSKQCGFNHQCKELRTLPQFSHVGQNLYQSMSYSTGTGPIIPLALQGVYSHPIHYNSSNVK